VTRLRHFAAPLTAGPLRFRNFRIFFAGRVIDSLGDGIVPAALTLAIIRATGSASALALVLGCALVPRLLLLPLGGVAADRLQARRVGLVTDLVRGVAQLAVGLELLAKDHPSLAHIAVASAVGGAASAFGLPTASPLVAATVPDNGSDRQRANALMGIARSATNLVGPALAGVLILTAGPGWAFILDAATFGIGAATLAIIRTAHVAIPTQSLRADLLDGWAEVRTRTWYWTSLIAHACWNFAAGVLVTLGPLIAVEELGGEAVWVAVLQAGAIGVLVGSLLAAKIHPRRPILVANLGLALYAAPLLLLAATAPAPWLVGASAVALTALGFLNPVWETAVQRRVPSHALARVSAYDWLVSLAAMPLGYALGPALADAAGPGLPLVGAAILVAASSIGTAAVRDVRNLESAPSADPIAQPGADLPIAEHAEPARV
jgi:MFS family permease